MISILPHVKKLAGTSLWEIRILGQDNIRVIYAIIQNDQVLLLHGFVKKKKKTPIKDLSIAQARYKDWLGKTKLVP